MANANPKLERMGSGWLLRMQSQGELEGDIMANEAPQDSGILELLRAELARRHKSLSH